MDSATLIRRARLGSGLSQRQLADKAQTSASAVCLYETGQRIPRVDTLARLLAATGNRLVLDMFEDAPLDYQRNSEVLLQVLELSEHLPFRREEDLKAPVFGTLAS